MGSHSGGSFDDITEGKLVEEVPDEIGENVDEGDEEDSWQPSSPMIRSMVHELNSGLNDDDDSINCSMIINIPTPKAVNRSHRMRKPDILTTIDFENRVYAAHDRVIHINPVSQECFP